MALAMTLLRKRAENANKARAGRTRENVLPLQELVQALRAVESEKLAARSRREKGGRRRLGKAPRVPTDCFSVSKGNEKVWIQICKGRGPKSLRDGQEMSWLVEDMCNQLRTWGHAGGAGGELIVKSDGNPQSWR